MTDTPRYFQPLDVPDFCYIWDAIMWVAFGRFPRETHYIVTDGYPPEFDDYGWKIGTLSFAYKDAPLRPDYRFDGFWPSEVAAAGLTEDSVDWRKYEGLLSAGYVRAEILEEELGRARALPPRSAAAQELSSVMDKITANFVEDILFPEDEPYEPAEPYDQAYIERLERRLSLVPFVDGVHRLLQHHVDRAWVKIFTALVDKKLQAYGWREMDQDEIRAAAADIEEGTYTVINRDDGSEIHSANEHLHLGIPIINPYRRPMPRADLMGPLESMACLDIIPSTDLSLSGFAPDACYRTASGRLWRDVIFQSSAIFELAPRPLLAVAAPDRVQIEQLTPAVAISTGTAANDIPSISTGSPTPRRRPGAPKKRDGEIERACQALYGRRLRNGEKEAALLNEAQAIVMTVWSEHLHRSTFQAYMAPFKQKDDGVPEIAPEIAAE